MTEKELALMEESRGFSKVAEETKRSIYEECRQMLIGKVHAPSSMRSVRFVDSRGEVLAEGRK